MRPQPNLREAKNSALFLEAMISGMDRRIQAEDSKEFRMKLIWRNRKAKDALRIVQLYITTLEAK